MPSTITDRTSGLGTGAIPNGENATVSQKVPCRVATVENITLSGLQTIDTVTVAAADRVLVKNQTEASQNGIYLASADAWQRTADCVDAGDLVRGSQVRVNEGASQTAQWYCTGTDPIVIGADDVTWHSVGVESVLGLLGDILKVELLAALNVEDGADVTDPINIAAAVNAVLGKAAPVDADRIGLIDSADSSSLKGLTWANIKTALETHLDTLYQPKDVALDNVREVLTANRNYFVRKDGNDSNTGLVNDASGAVLTIGQALLLASRNDFNSFTVTIKINTGTYDESVFIPKCIGQRNGTSLVLEGDTVTPANVTINGQSAFNGCITTNAPGLACLVRGLRLTGGVDNAFGLYASVNSFILVGGPMEFGSFIGNFSHQVHANRAGSIQLGNESFTISGGAGYFLRASTNGVVEMFGSPTWTFIGTPAWVTAGLAADKGGIVNVFATLNGAATGKRYDVFFNGVVQTGGGANYMPGNAAGTTATGGQYT